MIANNSSKPFTLPQYFSVLTQFILFSFSLLLYWFQYPHAEKSEWWFLARAKISARHKLLGTLSNFYAQLDISQTFPLSLCHLQSVFGSAVSALWIRLIVWLFARYFFFNIPLLKLIVEKSLQLFSITVYKLYTVTCLREHTFKIFSKWLLMRLTK